MVDIGSGWPFATASVFLHPILQMGDQTLFGKRMRRDFVREGQARLVRVFWESSVAGLRRLISAGVERHLLHNFHTPISCALTKFLLIMRSERLEEVLLLKYLEEDGVDMEVAKGVYAATEALEAQRDVISTTVKDHIDFGTRMNQLARRVEDFYIIE